MTMEDPDPDAMMEELARLEVAQLKRSRSPHVCQEPSGSSWKQAKRGQETTN